MQCRAGNIAHKIRSSYMDVIFDLFPFRKAGGTFCLSHQGELMDQGTRGLSEDWLSVWIGLLVFVLALAMLGGADILGWVVTASVWTDVSKALNPVSKGYSALGGVGALIATYVALLVVMTAGAAALKADLKRFALGFTAVFWISYLSWIAGSYAN